VRGRGGDGGVGIGGLGADRGQQLPVPEDVVAGDCDVVGGGIPGEIDAVVDRRDGREVLGNARGGRIAGTGTGDDDEFRPVGRGLPRIGGDAVVRIRGEDEGEGAVAGDERSDVVDHPGAVRDRAFVVDGGGRAGRAVVPGDAGFGPVVGRRVD